MLPNPQKTADLVTFTEEILNGKLHFLCSDSNGLVVVKREKKLEIRDHKDFEPIRPRFIVRMLEYLKNNNELYRDTTVDTNYIRENFVVDLKKAIGRKVF